MNQNWKYQQPQYPMGMSMGPSMDMPINMNVANANMGITPSQILQQQQLFGGGMPMPINNMSNMNMVPGGMGSINPAALSAGTPFSNTPSQAQQSNSFNLGLGSGGGMGINANMAGMGGGGMSSLPNMPNMNMNVNMNAMGNMTGMNSMLSQSAGPGTHVSANANLPNNAVSNPMPNLNPMAVLNTLGLSREQFQALSPTDKQKMFQMASMQLMSQQQNQQQQHQQHQAQMMMQNHNQNQDRQQSGQQVGQQAQAQDAIMAMRQRSASASSGVGPYFDRPSSSASASSHIPHGLPPHAQQLSQSHHPSQSQQHPQHPQHQSHQGQSQPQLPQQAPNQQQMMPPPPPRPSTAQSPSRPGTSNSHRSSSGPGVMHSPTFPSAVGSAARPPSRSMSGDFGYDGMVNGFAGPNTNVGVKPLTPMMNASMSLGGVQQQQHGMMPGQGSPPPPSQSQHQSQAQSQVQMHSPSHAPIPSQSQSQTQQLVQQQPGAGSPTRGAKRKLMESPRVGAGVALPGGAGEMMGPPGMLMRQGGEQQQQGQSQLQGQQGQQGQMQQGMMNGVPVQRPQSANANARGMQMGGMGGGMGMGNMGMMGNIGMGGMGGNMGNMMGGMGGGMGGMGGMGNMASMGMGGMGGMGNMGMGMNMGNMNLMNMGVMGLGMPGSGAGGGDDLGGMGGNLGIGMGGDMTTTNANNTPSTAGTSIVPPRTPQRQGSMPPQAQMQGGVGMGMNMNVGMGIPGPGAGMGMGANAGMGMGGIGGGMGSGMQGMHGTQSHSRQASVGPIQAPGTPVKGLGASAGAAGGGAGMTPGEMNLKIESRGSVPPAGGAGTGMTGAGVGASANVAPSTNVTATTSTPQQPAATTLTPATAAPSSTSVAASSTASSTASTASSSTATSSTATSATATSTTTTVIPSLPPLPANVNLNPAVTRVTVIPLIDSHKTISELSEDEITQIKEWMEKDKEYEAVWRAMKERVGEEMKGVFGPAPGTPASGANASARGTGASGGGGAYGQGIGAGLGPAWWEKGSASVDVNLWRRRGREGFDVRYPKRRDRERERERERERGRGKVVRREGLRLPRKLKEEDATRTEQLVPIRLEFDVEHHKMRETFVWNLNDPVVTPESFAQSLVEDYGLSSSYHLTIVKSIQDQLSDFKAHSASYDGEGGDVGGVSFPLVNGAGDSGDDGPVRGTLNEEDVAWWESWRKRMRTEYGFVKLRGGKNAGKGKKRRKSDKNMLGQSEDGGERKDGKDKDQDKEERPMTVNEFVMDEKLIHEDMRILIRLDIIVGSMKLDDQFEWDLENPDASPEQFSEVYATELGLGGEFKTAIAHSIREQVQTYQKSLFLVGHPLDGSLVQDEDLRMSFLPSLTSGARAIDQVQAFTPILNYLSDGEIERNEKERDKDMNKRRKRNTRGRRGIALPDREPIRTYRTPAVGFPELDPATLALAAAANAPVSRRAAAAAASVTIANMVASENGTAFIPPTMPTIPQPAPTLTAASKDKKPRGLFKGPEVPQEALRPRAFVNAPTSSTAADVSRLPAPLADDPPMEIPVMHMPAAPVDSKTAKILSAKRAKELEREAKEKEFVDGQHPNYIDGVWHCSNCGCPESIAIGRRKGPLGDKSQCGTCGKFWHRHRRPRPVEYNSDPDYHMRQAAEAVKSATKKKGGAAAALRAQSTTVPNTPVDGVSEPQTPRQSNLSKMDVEPPSRQSPPPAPAMQPSEDDRAISPVSTASSASEPPLAQKVRMNGAGHAEKKAKSDAGSSVRSDANSNSNPNGAPLVSASATSSTPDGDVKPTSNPVAAPPLSTGEAPSSSPPKSPWPPQWLTTAMQAMQAKYPDDKFEVILRKVQNSTSPEWRIKCSDCPGKLYTPGPGETLSNYEVHLKNRQHRQRVNERVNGQNGAS